MSTPRIVVLMGVYNEEQYLRETIPAVLAQTMPDFLLFILDNGSTDESWNILCDLAARDARITLLRSPRNLPCPEAMNLGTHAAMAFWPDCQWFVGEGADDMMDADYLQAILETAAKHPRANCIFSPARYINRPGTYTYPDYDPTRTHEKLFVPGWRAFTRELWNAVGPENTDIGPGSDWEWICRASVKGMLRPHQLHRSYNALRVRTDRKAQSDMGNWNQLHARMCQLMKKPVPRWAREAVVG